MRTLLSLVLLPTVLLSACGARDRDPVDLATDAVGVNVNGTEYWSIAVDENGDEVTLVAGTRLSLRFAAGEISARAGCNHIGGTYTLDGDVLVIDEMFSTEMGCDPALHAQDEFLIEVLTSRPTLTVGAGSLTVATPTVTIEFLDREIVEVDEPLIGTTWVVDGFFDPVAATAYSVDVPATFVFDASGRVAGSDGCAEFDLAYQATDTTVAFGGAPSGNCSEYASAFANVLGRGQLTVEIQGPRMTLTAEDGTGLTARSD